MMRPTPLLKTPRRPGRWLGVSVALAVLAAASPARASGIPFAAFQQLPHSGNPFTFTSDGSSASFKASTEVAFHFTSQSGLQDTGTHVLTLELDASTNAKAMGGSVVEQALNGRGTPGGVNTLKIYDSVTHQNYLTMNFTGDILGHHGTANATFAGDTRVGQTVRYSSDFLKFGSGGSFLIGLPAVDPGAGGLHLGAGMLLSSFASSAQGLFSAELGGSGPIGIAAVPVPTSVVMFGTGLAATAALRTWKRRRSDPCPG